MGSITIATWNLNLIEISNSAPKEWTTAKSVEQIVKTLAELNADIIAIQEIPNERYIQFLCKELGMVYTTAVPSHSGLVTLLIRPTITIKQIIQYPPAIIVSCEIDNKDVDIATCHLPPSNDAKLERLFILSKLKENLQANYSIVMGDMNMRDNETKGVLELGYTDVFLMMGSPKDKRFTWDSRTNIFRKESYGFVCRFDRVFTTNLQIKELKLIGNTPVNPNHYLSDHYGIHCTMEFM